LLKIEELSMDTTSFYFETNDFRCGKYVKIKPSEIINETTTTESFKFKLNKNGDKDK
jgi:hypothetical protein